jgi:hypothetical protein
VREKIIGPNEARGACIAVDIYNQFSTIYAALTGEQVYRCSDGLLRDALLGATGNVTQHREGLAEIAAAGIAALKPQKVYAIIDSQPSRSALLAQTVHNAFTRHGVSAETMLEKKADKKLVELGRDCIVATSDIVIVERVTKILDLAYYITLLAGAEKAVTDITLLLDAHHRQWCTAAGP